MKVIINNSHVMLPEGKIWAMRIINCIINNQSTRNLIVKNIAPDNKYSLINILDLIIEEFDYKHEAQIVKDQLMNRLEFNDKI